MQLEVSNVSLRDGTYSARVKAEDGPAPELSLLHQGAPLPELTVTDRGHGYWDVACPLPARLLTDGVQTLHLTQGRGESPLHSLAISVGSTLDGDLVAEVALLRDELEIVKHSLRQLVRAKQD